VIRAAAITQARRAIGNESDTGAAPAILSRPRVGNLLRETCPFLGLDDPDWRARVSDHARCASGSAGMALTVMISRPAGHPGDPSVAPRDCPTRLSSNRPVQAQTK
jgi:hypothetical protein